MGWVRRIHEPPKRKRISDWYSRRSVDTMRVNSYQFGIQSPKIDTRWPVCHKRMSEAAAMSTRTAITKGRPTTHKTNTEKGLVTYRGAAGDTARCGEQSG